MYEIDTCEVGLKTELVARDAGQHPTTERELQKRKDEIAESLRARGIDQETIDRASAKLDAPSAETLAANYKAEGNMAFKEPDYDQLHASNPGAGLCKADSEDSQHAVCVLL